MITSISDVDRMSDVDGIFWRLGIRKRHVCALPHIGIFLFGAQAMLDSCGLMRDSACSKKLVGKQPLLPLVEAGPAQARQFGNEYDDLSAREICRVKV
jgi:hypothetical protein